MQQNQQLIAQIEDLFHPRSIAIVGAPRGLKTGSVFLTALLDQGFPGHIYPVNPQAEQISGLKAYPSIGAIPGPVDLAIVLVPHDRSLAVLQECANKGIKGAVLFTAGYKETGTAEGKALETELVRVARNAGMRLVGPNGMGLYCPKTGLSFFPQVSKDPGSVGLISHSGSLTNIMGMIAAQRGVRFSKVISSGNDCDLTAADFLAYLGQDAETEVIGAYIEGVKDGPQFFEALKGACLAKPVIIWKVGLTAEGSRAAASHTGALAGSRKIWKSLVRQTGVVPVVGFEAWVDALMSFSLLPFRVGPRMAIISGPGGLAVSAAEACGEQRLMLAGLSGQTRSRLAAFIPATGTSLRNPIDVSLTAHFDLNIFKQAARTAAADAGVDAVVVIGCGLSEKDNQTFVEYMIGVRNEYRKPLLIVKIPGFDPKLGQQFCEANIPFFDTAERAMQTYASVVRYRQWRQNQISE